MFLLLGMVGVIPVMHFMLLTILDRTGKYIGFGCSFWLLFFSLFFYVAGLIIFISRFPE